MYVSSKWLHRQYQKNGVAVQVAMTVALAGVSAFMERSSSRSSVLIVLLL